MLVDKERFWKKDKEYKIDSGLEDYKESDDTSIDEIHSKRRLKTCCSSLFTKGDGPTIYARWLEVFHICRDS